MKDRLFSIVASILSLISLLVEKDGENNKKTIILVSHSALESGGAPVVLFELAREINKEYNVVFMSKRPGNLIDICRKNGMHSYVYGYFQKVFFKCLERKYNVKSYIVNTIVCGDCIEVLQSLTNKPIVWWLHENEEIYKTMKKKLPKSINNCIDVRCVSFSAQRAFKKYYPQNKTSLMFYGLPDLYRSKKRTSNCDSWRLLTVGQIVKRKNFILLLEAWENFSSTVQLDVELVIVGQGEDNDAYYDNFLDKVKSLNNVKHLPFVPRDKMKDIYLQSDAFICVSISDPLPVVVSEAFMFEIPCIIGSGVGQYEMINDGVNGYLCISENEKSIRDAICRAFYNRGNNDVGCEGRKLYNQYFSIRSVKESVLNG